MNLYDCKKCGRKNLLVDEITWNCIWPSVCKICKREMSAMYRKNGGIRYSRNKSFKNKYGITIEQYELMLENQNNACLICERNFTEKIKPDVDHHHNSGKVRGILCHTCNLALGYLKENKNSIENMLEYLQRTTWSKEGESDVPVLA